MKQWWSLGKNEAFFLERWIFSMEIFRPMFILIFNQLHMIRLKNSSSHFKRWLDDFFPLFCVKRKLPKLITLNAIFQLFTLENMVDPLKLTSTGNWTRIQALNDPFMQNRKQFSFHAYFTLYSHILVLSFIYIIMMFPSGLLIK